MAAAGDLLHTAPCSVLIARPVAEIEAFPRSLVVGLDGSAQAGQALTVAQDLATRFDSDLRVITALKGEDIDLRHVHLRTPFARAVDQHPVNALVEASNDADLLIVGSRGLHGLRALASVSERIAHQAACSVLVVRLPARIRRSTFSSAEWELLCLAPTYAGLIVAAAQRGGFFWEALSIAKTFAEVRAHQGANPLLDDICAERPLVEHTRFRSDEELRRHGFGHIRAAIELLERKAEPTDVDAYARFLTEIAEHVARAYPETAQPVSAAEEDAIAAVKAAVARTGRDTKPQTYSDAPRTARPSIPRRRVLTPTAQATTASAECVEARREVAQEGDNEREREQQRHQRAEHGNGQPPPPGHALEPQHHGKPTHDDDSGGDRTRAAQVEVEAVAGQQVAGDDPHADRESGRDREARDRLNEPLRPPGAGARRERKHERRNADRDRGGDRELTRQERKRRRRKRDR